MSAPVLTPQAAAGQAAANTIGQINRTVQSIQQILTNGVPAMKGPQGDTAAISADDLQAALGTAAIAKLQAVVAAWTA